MKSIILQLFCVLFFVYSGIHGSSRSGKEIPVAYFLHSSNHIGWVCARRIFYSTDMSNDTLNLFAQRVLMSMGQGLRYIKICDPRITKVRLQGEGERTSHIKCDIFFSRSSQNCSVTCAEGVTFSGNILYGRASVSASSVSSAALPAASALAAIEGLSDPVSRDKELKSACCTGCIIQ